MTTIQADPYLWPYNGDLRPENTALIIIDMQTDFCGPGGYVDTMVTTSRSPGRRSNRSRRCSRPCGPRATTSSIPVKAIGPDLSDLPPNKRWRSRQIALASATRVLAVASWCVGSPAGKS